MNLSGSFHSYSSTDVCGWSISNTSMDCVAKEAVINVFHYIEGWRVTIISYILHAIENRYLSISTLHANEMNVKLHPILLPAYVINSFLMKKLWCHKLEISIFEIIFLCMSYAYVFL